jgi:MotA/TolQ/ExbB proton channel family
MFVWQDAAPLEAPSAEPVHPRTSASAVPLAFLSRCVVLQAIGAAGIAGLWVAGIASKPFEGENAFLCWLIVALAALGILCVFLRRWRDVQWLATHVVRLGLLGTVVGLIIAFSAAKTGGSADPSEIRPMIAAVVDGMYVSLYATLLGIATNLWLKINLRVLAQIDG